MTTNDALRDGQADRIDGWVGRMIDDCLQNGVLAADYTRYARAYTEKMDSEGSFHGEFWGKWFTSAALGVRYRDTPQGRALLQDAVRRLLAAQEENGRLSASATDFTIWDLWGRKYALLGLVAWYDLSGDRAALEAAGRMLDNIIDCTMDAGVKITETGLRALQAASSCSILQPVVQLYDRTRKPRYLQFAEHIVQLWSEPSAYNPRGMRLLEDALDGVPPVKIAAPKGYELMSCWEGVCELYRVTGKRRYLDAVLAYMEGVQQREVMITGSGSSSEMWCEGRYRQTQLLEAPMETCVTATYMKLCHQLLRLTGDRRWADQLEISLFNALSGSMKKDGSWWGYFNPLQGQRVLSQVQLEAMQSSCCVVNGPRALLEVPYWALMSRADGGCAVCLYQPGEYACGEGEGRWQLCQQTQYPNDGAVCITVRQAPQGEAVLALRIPAFGNAARLTVNGQPVETVSGSWCEVRRRWQPGDELRLQLDVRVRIVDAPANPIYKALMAGPVVLGLDNRYNRLPPDESLWLMNDAMHTVTDDQVEATYYALQSLPEESDAPLVQPVELPQAHMGFAVSFLKRPIHFWGHEVKQLTFCDYASCGNDFAKTRSIRVWVPMPLYTGTLFPMDSQRVISMFSDDNCTL